ncbi:MAG: NAD(P)-dependent dehydrogenase (short-subunit alcohol dehydrogenase family) [Parasphingorhabdus sp.]|jgi:NAD(P)-dependent dehydrogenase (short-subunit alcohol dehydrogenase family)
MLNGSRAIVTGGLEGIGLAIATELSKQGASVVIGSRRGDDEKLVVNVMAAMTGPCRVIALDVASGESIGQFMQQAETFHGESDLLINNAGVSAHHGVDGHSEEDWNRVIDINLSGPFRMMKACLPAMKRNQYGRIVNIASTAARVAEPTHAAYCASKAGLVGLSKAVAREGAPDGITCMCVSPTWVETSMLRASAQSLADINGRSYAEEIELMKQSNPQGRLTQPEEIAAVVVFCCSGAAPALTMEDIQVNAGALW